MIAAVVVGLAVPGSAQQAVDHASVGDALNEVARNTTFGPRAYPPNPAPSFGRATAVGDPRSAQFAVRLRF